MTPQREAVFQVIREREDPAAAVILEAAPDQTHAVRKQRRREGVALVALKRTAVETERTWLHAIDEPSRRKPRFPSDLEAAALAITALGYICLVHAMTHLGEISMGRALVGAKS